MNNEQLPRPEPPSDLELMTYFDGELAEPRRAEVAAFVGADLRARSKVAGLRIAAAVVQNEAQSLTAADDIADLVMARLAREAAAPPAEAPQIALAAPAHVTPLLAPQPYLAPARPAANDNSRRLFVGLAALVAVAAAVFAVWGRQPSAPTAATSSTQSAVVALGTPDSPATASPPSLEPEIDVAAVTPEAGSDQGVQVAAVNFGAHMGSIFYVPSGSIEAKRTTTVVWLADDAGE